MDEALVTVTELAARCDWTFDDDEERAAAGYLEEASDLARAYGRATWTPENAPRLVKSAVISAVRRYMRNPEGYTQSRAGDETLAWSDLGHDAATIYFTTAEQKLLRGLGGNGSTLRSSSIMAWGQTPRNTLNPDSYVPVSGYPGERPFPLFTDPVEPW